MSKKKTSTPTLAKPEFSEYYGLVHSAVNQKFTGGLTFLCEMTIRGEYRPWAFYLCADPDRSKGHKEIVMIRVDGGDDELSKKVLWVTGMALEDFKKKWAKHDAVKCLECGRVMHSINRHDYKTCGCPQKTMVDGGRDYLRCGGVSMAKVQVGTIDFLSGKFSKSRRKYTPKS
jgi:hypothetical protein